MVAWNPPATGAFKINVDGSVSWNKGAACGVIRTHSGDTACILVEVWVTALFQIEVELLGILNGLEVAWKEGVRHSTLETDSRTALSFVNDSIRDSHSVWV